MARTLGRERILSLVSRRRGRRSLPEPGTEGSVVVARLDEARSGLRSILLPGSEGDEIEMVCTALEELAGELVAAVEDTRLNGAVAAALLRAVADDLDREQHDRDVVELIVTVGNRLVDAAAQRDTSVSSTKR